MNIEWIESVHQTGGGTGHRHQLEWLQQTVTSLWMIAAVVVEAACFAIWMQVLSELELSKAFPLLLSLLPRGGHRVGRLSSLLTLFDLLDLRPR